MFLLSGIQCFSAAAAGKQIGDVRQGQKGMERLFADVPAPAVTHRLPQKGRDDGFVVLRKQVLLPEGETMAFSIRTDLLMQYLGSHVFRGS